MTETEKKKTEKKNDALAAVATTVSEMQSLALTPQNVKMYLCETATDAEIAMFLNICVMQKLNPFLKQIYLIKYGKKAAQFVVAYEEYLKRAERTQRWNGFEVKTEGSIDDGTLKAVCTVYRKDWTRPLVHEVYYDEYKQMVDCYKWDKEQQKSVPTGEKRVTEMWATKPRTMLKKVAVEQAHRMAFPEEMGDLPYGVEELVAEPTARDIEVAERDKHVAEILKRPLTDIDDEFGTKPKTAAAAAQPPVEKKESAKKQTLFDDEEKKPAIDDGSVSALQIQKMKAGIEALTQRGVDEETIFAGIIKKVQKAFNVTIVELGDMKREHADKVIAYLAKWAETLDAEDAARKGGQ